MSGNAEFAATGHFEGRGLACVRGERAIFAELEFTLKPGGAMVVTGPNGSGKSSLLRLLAGLLPPAAGSLLWDGVPVGRDPELHRSRLHYISHHDALKGVLSTWENLAFWAGLRGATRDTARRALERFALAGLAELPGRQLSAGQRRRLSLARLLAAPAPLWLLDEPSVGLDSEAIATLTAEIARHRDQGGSVVVATHQALEIPGAATLAVDAYPPPEPDPEALW